MRQQTRRELLAESRKHTITAKLRQIPSLGPIRSALAVALIRTPHRFRSKRQLWTYSGLGLETRDSGQTQEATKDMGLTMSLATPSCVQKLQAASHGPS